MLTNIHFKNKRKWKTLERYLQIFISKINANGKHCKWLNQANSKNDSRNFYKDQ